MYIGREDRRRGATGGSEPIPMASPRTLVLPVRRRSRCGRAPCCSTRRIREATVSGGPHSEPRHDRAALDERCPRSARPSRFARGSGMPFVGVGFRIAQSRRRRLPRRSNRCRRSGIDEWVRRGKHPVTARSPSERLGSRSRCNEGSGVDQDRLRTRRRAVESGRSVRGRSPSRRSRRGDSAGR